jgi:hypothetical protein
MWYHSRPHKPEFPILPNPNVAIPTSTSKTADQSAELKALAESQKQLMEMFGKLMKDQVFKPDDQDKE